MYKAGNMRKQKHEYKMRMVMKNIREIGIENMKERELKMTDEFDENSSFEGE